MNRSIPAASTSRSTESAKSPTVSVRRSGTGSRRRDPPRTDFGGRSTASASPSRNESSGFQHHAPCAPPCTKTIGATVDCSGIPSDDLLAVPDDRDRLYRASLAGEDDLVLRLHVGIDDDRDAVVVEVEH